MKKVIASHPNFDLLSDKLSKKLNLEKLVIKFDKFPDSWPNYFIENVKENVEQSEVIYIWDFSTPELVFENYTIIRWLLDYQVAKLNIIMPFFPVGTMERIDKKWEVATAKYYADIFSNIPAWANWKSSIHIFDIHALSTRFFFDTFKINIDLHTAMNLIKQKISQDYIIAFPDEWAKKRFSSYFEWYEKILCSKVRIWDERHVTIIEWNPENKNIIIIDDLIQSGGTLIETAKVLKKSWAKKVEAFATHWVFPNNSFEKLAKNLDKLYTTNSIPKNTTNANSVENMEVLDIVEIIEKLV